MSSRPSDGCMCEDPHHEREEFIGCDGCNKWYHFSCVGLTTEIVDSMGESDEYHCPFCVSKRDVKHVTNQNNSNNNNKTNIEKKSEEIETTENTKSKDKMDIDKNENNNNNNNKQNTNISENKENEDVTMFENAQPTLTYLFKKPKAKTKSTEINAKEKKSVIERMNERIKKEEKQLSDKKKQRNSNKTSRGSNKTPKNNNNKIKRGSNKNNKKKSIIEKDCNEIIYGVENTHEHPNSMFRKNDEYIYNVFNFTKEVEHNKDLSKKIDNNKNKNTINEEEEEVEEEEEEEEGETYVFTEDNIKHLIPYGFMEDIESIDMFKSHKEYCERLKHVLEYSCLLELKIRSQNPELQQQDQNLINNCFQNTWKCPINSVPIRCDVRKFDFNKLIEYQMKYNNNKLFDIIMMDPPWQLASSNPTRGVALGYDQLQDAFITQIPIEKLQTDGFIFIWIINGKYKFATELLKHWGYKLVGDIAWIKSTVNFRISRGHGFYLQHGKETCFVGKKGNPNMNRFRQNVCSDAIFSLRRGQSQKPTEIYEFIEQFAPPTNGHTYIEIFGRRNNLRNGWVTLGNEL